MMITVDEVVYFESNDVRDIISLKVFSDPVRFSC